MLSQFGQLFAEGKVELTCSPMLTEPQEDNNFSLIFRDEHQELQNNRLNIKTQT